VKVFAHNFNPVSNSGPNKFTRTLFHSLTRNNKIVLVNNQRDADVEFCLIQQQLHKVKPMVLRLDGIWFNSEQEYNKQNAPIKYAYDNAEAVIFQSEFNKKLTETWFGKHINSYVIHNAADDMMISNANKTFWNEKLGYPEEVWSCASSWRPHKRLNENIRYFLDYAPKNAILAVAGKGATIDDVSFKNNKRIVFLGELDYMSLLSLYKLSSTFIHLAYLDHCPNVVVDAQAAGCKVICSSSGGTKEVISNGVVIIENEWDYTPIPLYKPPKMNFDNIENIDLKNKRNSLELCSKNYFKVMESLL
jgi:glycosyltransferase involved in cell wall biosynthesis|tara:strand:+ start:14229 stop:15143 length:915 start_codon:yes stop_codon:yes gene_type:complete